jgi:hypothetical protein
MANILQKIEKGVRIMTVQALLFLVNTLKTVQAKLRTQDLLTGLTMVYELSEKDHLELQKDVYKLSHPAMEGFEEKDMFELELLETKFIFTKQK